MMGFFFTHIICYFIRSYIFFDCCKEEGWDNKTSFCTVQFYYCLCVGNILVCALLIFWLNLNNTENFSDSNLNFTKENSIVIALFHTCKNWISRLLTYRSTTMINYIPLTFTHCRKPTASHAYVYWLWANSLNFFSLYEQFMLYSHWLLHTFTFIKEIY